MSVPKRALRAIILALIVFAIYRVMAGGIEVTGSGGLGAVSAGFSEALIEAFILAVVVATFFYARSVWQRRRSP